MSAIWTQADIEEREERVRMIRDSAASMVARHGGVRRAREVRYGDAGMDRDVWRDICEAGLLGLRIAEARGGSGLGMVESVALQEELGRHLVPEPLLDAALVAELLDGEEGDALLAGERLTLPAGLGGRAGAGLPRVESGGLVGEVAGVMLARAADDFLVATDDGALALVDAGAEGLTIDAELLQDGSHLGRLKLRGAPLRRRLGGDGVACARDAAALGCAAYLVGVMQGAFDLTLDYLKVRRQFGRHIGGFQGLQHRAVDMKIQMELARAMVQAAASAMDRGLDGALVARRIATARVKASTAALTVTREAIQMHGGIGYTDEADVGLYLRKVMTLLNRFGSVDEHRRRYASLMASAPTPDKDD